MKRRVVAPKHLPIRLPVFQTVTLWLLLDRLGVTGAWLGVIWTLWALLVLLAIVGMVTDEYADPFERKEQA